MPFWNRNKNWEDDYDSYYSQDRRSGIPGASGRFWFVRHLLLLGFVGVLFVAAVGVVSGKTMAEKLLTTLASPTGLIWLALILQVYFCLLKRQALPAMIGFCCWLVLTVGGNEIFSNWLIRSLERPYEKIEIMKQEPFETVVLLGGGTMTNRTGMAQLSYSGDRVVIAAKLYHAGLAKRIVCTGSQKFRSTPNDLHPRQEAYEVLIGLNLPKQDVLQMKGENTFQEMARLKTWLEENGGSGRIGLLTSAYHLPRATRLAKANGLDVVPIPANFYSEFYTPRASMVVPNSENLLVTSLALKEYLAGFVGR